MRNIYIILVSLLLSVSVFGQSGNFGESNALHWELSANGTLTISGTGAMPDFGVSANQPWRSPTIIVKAIVINEGITKIGNEAFYDLNDVVSVTIPNSVLSIGSYSFYRCLNLTSVTIGNNVTSIGEYAFDKCSRLTSVIMPNSVTSLGENAFSRCSNLSSVTLSNQLDIIDNNVFFECSSLSSIIIPNSIVTIDTAAFYGCSSLVSVIIPDHVTTIGYAAFGECSRLTSVTNLAAVPQNISNKDVFYDVAINTVSLYVPSESLDLYKSADVWKDFKFIGPTDIPEISTSVKTYLSNNILYLNTPVTETICIYSLSGSLLYRDTKQAGTVQIPLGGIQERTLIVGGSSGWASKFCR